MLLLLRSLDASTSGEPGQVFNRSLGDEASEELAKVQLQQTFSLRHRPDGARAAASKRRLEWPAASSGQQQQQQQQQQHRLVGARYRGAGCGCGAAASGGLGANGGGASVAAAASRAPNGTQVVAQPSVAGLAQAAQAHRAAPAPRAALAARRLSVIQEETANAMVGLMRLILVILICVLLVKLRAPKVANGGRRRRPGVTELAAPAGTERVPGLAHWGCNHDNHDNHSRETRISSAKQLDESTTSKQLGYNNCGRISTLANYSIDALSAAAQFRRHSQPHLAGHQRQQQQQLAAGSARSAGPGPSQENRRRRHSDTSASLVASLSLPPGPMGLPFLGYLPFLGNEIHLTLTELANRFGPIYQIFLGGIRVVVLNDAALVRQAFKQTVFSGRPDTQLTRILQGYGIVNSDGALWKEQRAFLHTALRKLGAKSLMSGSNGLEAKIQNQVKEFVNDLSGHAKEGKPCQVRPIVARAVSSVVGSIVMNLTYRKYEEKEKFDRLIELMQEGFRLFSIAMPLDFIPIFRFVPGVSYAYKKMKRNRAETSAFFQGVADEHRRYLSETFNLGAPNSTSSLHPRTSQQLQQPAPESAAAEAQAQQESAQQRQQRPRQGQLDAGELGDPAPAAKLGSSTAAAAKHHVELDNIVARDLVDAYIVQQKKHEKDGKENYFSDQQLVQIMSDIFSAGLETVTSTIEWSILFLILNPDCQTRIQQEIDRVVGRDRLPQLEDLALMPYTEATIYEVLRRSNVIALGNAHATLADASIGGYRIPKGTQVLPNLYGIHMNPKLWNEPQRFDPSRFIINERAQKPDFFIPFSVGRRMCLGDMLAKMEVFLFLVGLLQKYDLSVHDDDRECPPQVKGTIGVSNAPVSFRVAISGRNSAQALADRLDYL